MSKLLKSWRSRRSLGGLVTLALLLAMSLVSSVLAVPIAVIDDGGADDLPGQKDLNQMTVDYQPSNTNYDLTITWNWDEFQLSGNNTGDACSLFDTDGDGNANYSLCVVWFDGSKYQTTVLYSCNDTRTDRCAGATQIAKDADGDGKLDGNYATTCSVAKTSTDPFHSGQSDLTATCNIKLSDINASTDPFLTNVCSYPSSEPNSDPSDCVVSPKSGFLTIKKDAGSDTTTPFNFTLSPAANNGTSAYTINGTGAVSLIVLDASKDYSLSEGSLPADWQFDTASCVTNGTSTGTLSGTTIIEIDIQVSKETVCTFKNKHITPTITVDKTANPTSVAETGGSVTYTYKVTNTTTVPLTISSLSDDKFGTLTGDADCQLNTVLAAGASCEFTTTQTVSGNAGTSHTNVFTAVATAAWGATATNSDNAVVTFTNVPPTLEVTKTANPTSVPESGGSVTFSYTVKNTSAESVTITELKDDKFGTLTGSDSCKVGTILAAGASCSFTYTTTLSGNAGTTHTNTFSATVVDDDNSSATATATATVTFTDVAPTLEVTKTADPTSLPETGGNVTYTYTVKNTSFESVTITALSDDKFGVLAGDSDCQLGTVLAPGASCSFTYTTLTALVGEAGTTHVNVFTATVKDNDNTSVSATDDATVTFTDVPPEIMVEKTADPISVPETGGSVTFTYKVTNTGTEPVTITSLSDNKFSITGDDDCKVGTELGVGASCEFTYTTTLKGDAGSSHINVFTAKAVDNDGSIASDDDDATVTFSDVKPSITVTKTADPISVPETGGSVTYTYVVQNNTAEPVTITALSDDMFAAVAGDADCKVGTLLPGNGSCSFEYTTTISGDYPGNHVNVFTVTVKDDENNTASDDDDATVDFTDVLPDISVTKTADPTHVDETGGSVTFTYVVTNNSTEAATIDSLSDDKFGTLAGDDDCKVGTSLAAGASCEFTYTKTLSGEAGAEHVNIFSATASDNDGNSDSASDNETVTFDDVLPDISVTKTADPTHVAETGGSVTFTYVVTNNSKEAATINSLSDDKFVEVAGDADCKVGTILAAGASCSFSYTTTLSGEAGTSHVNTITITASDNDGNSDTATDDATVTFDDVMPTIEVVKSATPSTVPETGGSVTFAFKVTNTSNEPVTISSLSDSVYGTLQGDPSCKVGTVLQPNEWCIFTLTQSVSGDYPNSHENTFTAEAKDNEGNIASDTDDATVSYTDVLPDVSVTKVAMPISVPETGGDVTFYFTVKNNSSEAATITSLTDSVYGSLAGDADCEVGTVLAPGASCEFSIIRNVKGEYPGSHTNTFTAVVSDDDGNSDNGSDDALVTFTDVKPEVTVSKSANPTSIPETGANVDFTFTVTNSGAVTATITELKDSVFGTLAGDADCQIDTELAPGASCTFTITKWVSGDYGTDHINTFTATVKDDDGNSASDDDDETVVLEDVKPDVTVTKSANPTSIPETGANVTFTFTVTNNGQEAAEITALSDSVFGTLAGDDDCKVGTLLAGGASCTFSITEWIEGDASVGDHTNVFTGTVKDDDGNTDSDDDDETVDITDVLPDVTVEKSANPTSVPETGGDVTFTFVVTNNSKEAATITALSDSVFGTLAGNDDCKIGTSLAAGASCEFTVVETISGGTTDIHKNVFTATVADNDGNTDSDDDDATVTFTDVKPSVMVEKTASPSSVPETGGDVTFTFVVTNNGTVSATILSLVDDTYGTLTGDADCAAGTILAPGASCEFTLEKKLSGTVGVDHVNVFTATVVDKEYNQASDDDDATVSFDDVLPKVTVTKSANPTSVPETGANVTFTFTVANTGDVTATITELKDSVFGTLTGDADCKVGTELVPGASCTFEISRFISGDYGTDHRNIFTATVKDTEGNPASDDDDATVVLEDVKPDVTVTKSANPTSIPETGANVTFTFTVTNNGQEAAEITGLSDSVFGTLAGDDDCKVGTLLAGGASCTFSITKWIDGDASVGDHTNVFTGTVKDDDGNTDSDDDDETVDITDVLPDVTVTKSANPTAVPETGGDVTFTFVVTNNSKEAATITALSDTVFGELAGDDDCKVGTVLAGGASCEFSITKSIAGDASAAGHYNVFTGSVKDNDGNTYSDDDDATVTYTDVKPTLDVTKSANPTSVPETGANVTYTFVVKNTSGEPVTITALSDNKFGTLAGDDDCKLGTVLAAGTSCEFSISKWIAGDASGAAHTNVFTASVKDNENNTVSDTDDETVSFTDVKPTVEVTKTANPTSVPESGANVTYTFVVKNTSGEPVTITVLSDDTFGTLAGDADCKVGTILAAGASCEFTLVKFISGDYPGNHTNVFTATVKDNENNTVSDDDDAVVSFTDVLPDIVITKTASPTAVPFQGANVTFTFTVWNKSTEPATLTTLTDTVFGNLNGKGTCIVPQSLAATDGTQGGADTYTCTYTVFIKATTMNSNGMGYVSHYNVATATATDDDGNSDTASDDATVSFTWRGRTPGYWKNHPKDWPTFSITNYKGATVQVTTKTLVRDVFNVPTTKTYSCIGTKDSLLTALSYKGGSTLCGAVQILLRAATAGLLNEAYFTTAYPAYNSVTELINAVNAAIASGNRQTIIDLANKIDYWNNGIH